MEERIREVLQFVEENDVKFIRLAFCDLFGAQKNVAVMAQELPRAFEDGISFDASAIRGFSGVEDSDLFLRPDPSTLSVLPWRPSQGRVCHMFCQILRPDGSPFPGDSRRLLRQATRRLSDAGFSCRLGTECEFYLFEADEHGQPTFTPQDQGGYCDVAPLDKGENIRRQICLTLEEMGLHPECSHHEQGPGQNEIDFRHSDPLKAADQMLIFKSAVKSIAAMNGLYASFLPKPIEDRSGSGLHLNLSLFREGENLLAGQAGEAASFLQGVLDRAAEITAFLCPLTNSYRRFGAFEAPRYVTWSRGNRSQLVRIPAAAAPYSRMELRSPDPACNPYLAMALVMEAGLEGIREGKALQPSTDRDLYRLPPEETAGLAALPQTLEDALELAEGSSFVAKVLPEEIRTRYCRTLREEAAGIRSAADPRQAELALYFPRI